jgi:hypothetical protein
MRSVDNVLITLNCETFHEKIVQEKFDLLQIVSC